MEYLYCIDMDDCESLWSLKLLHDKLFTEKEFKNMVIECAKEKKILAVLSTINEVELWSNMMTFEELWDDSKLEVFPTNLFQILRKHGGGIMELLVEKYGFKYMDYKKPDVILFSNLNDREEVY